MDMIRKRQKNPQSTKTIDWTPGLLDGELSMYALPDTIAESTRFAEVRANAGRHLHELIRAVVAAHMPAQIVSLLMQGPNLIRDLVLLEKFVADGICNLKDHFTPTQYAWLTTAGLGLTDGANVSESTPALDLGPWVGQPCHTAYIVSDGCLVIGTAKGENTQCSLQPVLNTELAGARLRITSNLGAKFETIVNYVEAATWDAGGGPSLWRASASPGSVPTGWGGTPLPPGQGAPVRTCLPQPPHMTRGTSSTS